MTLDEAQLILNVKRGAEIQQILKVNYYYFFFYFVSNIYFSARTTSIFLKSTLPYPNQKKPRLENSRFYPHIRTIYNQKYSTLGKELKQSWKWETHHPKLQATQAQ